MSEWSEKTLQDWLYRFADSLGVTMSSLFVLGAAWAPEHRAAAFPMKNGYGEPVGIRLRNEEGRKWAVTGSHQGLFIPDMPAQSSLMVCEGPTDTSAALSIGMFAVGRPSCMGCEDMLNVFIRRHHVSRVTICADHDYPGQCGAEKFQASLKVPSIIWTPPLKDLRESVKAGLTAGMISDMTKDLIWTHPQSA